MSAILQHMHSQGKRFELPVGYQEVLDTHEILLSKGINTDILRKMVYLYTIAMEYYNLTKKKELEEYYNNKLVTLLTRPDVLAFLDDNPIDFNNCNSNNNNSNLNIFSSTSFTITNNNSSGNNNNNNSNSSSKIDDNFYIKKKQYNITREEILQKIRERINNVDVNVLKINEIITKGIVAQMAEYEEQKRKRKIRNNNNIYTYNYNYNTNNNNHIIESPPLSPSKCAYKLDFSNSSIKPKDSLITSSPLTICGNDLLSQLAQINNIASPEPIKPLNTNVTKRKKRVSIGQNQMLKEIEEYVEKNMNEMYKALDELKESFNIEIRDAEENGYPEIAKGLYEDMQVELENLKDQYEEQRRIETDKIRSKYQKRGSVYIN